MDSKAPLYLYDDPDQSRIDEEAPTLPSGPPESAAPQEFPAVLKISEAAKLLRVNRKTLYELVRRNALPGARRVGHVIRIDRDAVLDWFRSQGRVSRRNE